MGNEKMKQWIVNTSCKRHFLWTAETIEDCKRYVKNGGFIVVGQITEYEGD